MIYYSCLLTPLFFYPLSILVPLFSCFHPLILSFINPSVQLLLLLVTSEWSDPKDWFQPPPPTPPPLPLPFSTILASQTKSNLVPHQMESIRKIGRHC